MKPRWRTFLAGVLVLTTRGSSALAARLDRPQVGATSQGFLYIDYSLQEPFRGKARDAIRSGLPSTLTFTMEVWRQRTGWWDRLEETREIQFRVLRDLLNEQYVVVTPEEIRRFPDLDAIEAAVCRNRREYLRPLEPKATYYVTVNANLAPLSVDDLKELERWLQGTIRSGDQENPGGIVGISGTMVGLLLSLTGFGDESVRARSVTFVPVDVPPSAPAPSEPSRGVAGSAEADSGTNGSHRP